MNNCLDLVEEFEVFISIEESASITTSQIYRFSRDRDRDDRTRDQDDRFRSFTTSSSNTSNDLIRGRERDREHHTTKNQSSRLLINILFTRDHSTRDRLSHDRIMITSSRDRSTIAHSSIVASRAIRLAIVISSLNDSILSYLLIEYFALRSSFSIKSLSLRRSERLQK